MVAVLERLPNNSIPESTTIDLQTWFEATQIRELQKDLLTLLEFLLAPESTVASLSRIQEIVNTLNLKFLVALSSTISADNPQRLALEQAALQVTRIMYGTHAGIQEKTTLNSTLSREEALHLRAQLLKEELRTLFISFGWLH